MYTCNFKHEKKSTTTSLNESAWFILVYLFTTIFCSGEDMKLKKLENWPSHLTKTLFPLLHYHSFMSVGVGLSLTTESFQASHPSLVFYILLIPPCIILSFSFLMSTP